MIITDQESADLLEIQRLLDEGYNHNGHGKGDEGEITLTFNNTHDRNAGDPLRLVGIEVFSYAIGPGLERRYQFRTTAQALDNIRTWHAAEMASEYEAD